MKKEYNFYVYIMSNYKRSAYYVGFCNSLSRRLIEHIKGLGAEFTKKYKTKDLLYYEQYKYVNDAINREKEIKKWRREKKLDLIRESNPELKTLNQELFDNCGLDNDDLNEITEILKEREY